MTPTQKANKIAQLATRALDTLQADGSFLDALFEISIESLGYTPTTNRGLKEFNKTYTSVLQETLFLAAIVVKERR